MRVLIATSEVPFIRGGAESHVEGLRDALRAEGHQAEIVSIPFKSYPPMRILDQMIACRLLDLSEIGATTVDLVIGMKFPAYMVSHPNKIMWILHQHRQAYELWDHPMGDLHLDANGAQIRDTIRQADKRFIGEAKAVFANSVTVARRLEEYCGIASTPLYHPPPNAESFYCAQAEEYLFFPSRIAPMKRQSLALKALALTTQPVRILFLGAADHESYEQELRATASELGVADRAQWLGQVPDSEKFRYYAQSLGVIFPPFDEDYGYITLEALLSSKPVVTCADSGGPLEFVRDGETGLVSEPTPEALAAAFDALWADRSRTQKLGKAGRALYDSLGISWRTVVQKLLS
jgi:glycosyltransferase involved in cell wall biosynthesis